MNPNQSTGEVSVGGGAWKRVLVLMLFSLLVLAMLQSAALLTNTYDLPESPWTASVISTVEVWHNWMEQAGLAGLTERIAEEVEVLHTAPVTEETF